MGSIHAGPEALRVVITGWEGFVGCHLMKHLEDLGITAIPSSVWLPDRDGFARLLSECTPDAVIHLAAISYLPQGERDPVGTYVANVEGTRSVLGGIRDADPAGRIRMVFISSGQVYRPASGAAVDEDFPVSPQGAYVSTKLAAEIACTLLCQADRRPLVIFRPFNHIGPGQRPAFAAPGFARQVARIEAGLQEPVLHTGDLSASRDFCDVRDVVRAYALAAAGKVPPGTYNLASGRAVSLSDVARHFRSRSRVDFEIRQGVEAHREGEVREIRGSAEKIFRAARWKPEIPLEKTLDDILSEWRAKIIYKAGVK